MYYYFLGSHPYLSLAELESLLGSDIKLIDNQIASSSKKLDLAKLGGTIKTAQLITKLEGNDNLERNLGEIIERISPKPEGKLSLGISVYGRKMSPPAITKLGFEIKKSLKAKLNLRILPNKAQSLSSAQLAHIKLGRSGLELNLIFKGQSILVASTTDSQNLKSYTLRDYGRPARDARVGMLPPKLAQMMLNLSLGDTKETVTVLDPFCGTGVVLQEALLQGHRIVGSDIEPRMTEMTKHNLEFLNFKFKLGINQSEIENSTFVGDATDCNWPKFDVVASEVFLGQPLNRLPEKDKLEKIISDVNLITKKFLLNLKPQLEPGGRVCLAVPAWRNGNKFIELPLIDCLNDLGYNRLSLKLVTDSELIYFREDSTVARRILLLVRKEK
jgi:tRNA G10  N-methylase Trm11